jgi:pyruvate formate lyase activating enzyme
VVLDTCGHVAPETFRELAPLAGALLFDLKLMDEQRHEAFTGVHNRWILENLRWVGDGCGTVDPGLPVLEATPAAKVAPADGAGVGPGGGGVPERVQRSCPGLTVRLPLIPDVNDDEENLLATAEFLLSLATVPPLDILPYHRLGVDKYHRMGRSYKLSDVTPPETTSISNAVRICREAGLEVTVRGEPYGDD